MLDTFQWGQWVPSGPFPSLDLGFLVCRAGGSDRACITGRGGPACGKELTNIIHGCEEKALRAGALGTCCPVAEPKHPGPR